jgi:hypothetical protein
LLIAWEWDLETDDTEEATKPKFEVIEPTLISWECNLEMDDSKEETRPEFEVI